MLTVYAFFFSFVVVALMSRVIPDPRRRAVVEAVACAALLFGFFGVRGLPVLNDTAHYYGYAWQTYINPAFDDTSVFHVNPGDRFEPGYQILNRMVGKYVWRDAYAMILLEALAMTLATVWMVARGTRRVALTVFLMLASLLSHYSGLRQGLAIVLGYLALAQYERGRTWRFAALVAAAWTIHHSALVLLVVPPLCRLRVCRRNVLWFLAGSITVAVLIYPIVRLTGYDDSIYYSSGLARERFPLAAVISTAVMAIHLLACLYLHRHHAAPLPSRTVVWSSMMCLSCLIVCIPFLIFRRYGSYFELLGVLMMMQMIDYERPIPLAQTWPPRRPFALASQTRSWCCGAW